MNNLFARKFIAIVLVFTLVITVLGGCGSESVVSEETETNTTENVTKEDSKENNEQKNDSNQEEKELTGNLTIWSWNENDQQFADAFMNKHPEVKVDFVQTGGGGEYLKKLQIAVASGTELPDIIQLERGSRGKIIEMGILEDLEASRFGFNRNNIFEQDINEITDSEGRIVSIPFDMSISGFAYRKELARKYFGTDDPEELEVILSDWEKVFDLGKKVHNDSNGEHYMFASMIDVKDILFNQSNEPLAKGNTINMERIEEVYDMMLRMRDEKIVDSIKGWSPGWMASFAEANHIFYPCALWFPQFVLQPNNPDGEDEWGLMVPTGGGFVNGGTAIGISNLSKNKDVAWEYLKFVALSEEGATLAKQVINNLIHYKPMYENASYYSMNNPMFGEQNIGEKYFVDIMNTIKVRPVSKYDSLISEVTDFLLDVSIADPDMDTEEMVIHFKEEINNKESEVQFSK